MEQVHCWVWLNSKKEQIFKYSSPSSTMNSPTLMSNSSSTTWEEKAFAEDAAGHGPLGGCIWPPRSYSCSFCMREFRSAQALGGHMNVHRRDRARLKHCLNPNTAAATAITTVTATTTHLDPSSHSISSHSFVNASSISCPFSTLSPSRAPSSALIISSTHQKENSSISGTTEQAFLSSRSDSKPDLHHQIENNMALIREEDSIVCQLVGNDSDDGDEYNVETDLSVGLNISVVSRNRSAQGGCCGEDASNYKRPKVSSSFPCFLQAEVTGLVATSMEDNSLDLELRLGDPPKVK